MSEEHRKVAICGTAPASLKEAPFHDETWEIWGTSRLWKEIPRADVWFELHPLDEIGRGWDVNPGQREAAREEHVEWLAQSGIPVYLQEEDERVPTGVAYPLEEVEAFLAETFGDTEAYFTNTIAYMIALAIYQDVDEVGIWGVDMALADSEYGKQRPSCEYFIGLARGAGIPVHVPKTADLLKTAVRYGFEWEKEEAFRAKMDARNRELSERKQNTKNKKKKLFGEAKRLEGAVQSIAAILENGASLTDDDQKALKQHAEEMQQQRQQIASKMEELARAEAGFSYAMDNMDWVERTWIGCRPDTPDNGGEPETPELEVVGGA